MAAIANSRQDLAALVGRILMSAIFIWGGYEKLTAPAGTQAYFAHLGVTFPQLVWAAAVAIELIGGLLLLLGIQTRVAAAILGVWSIVTALVAHTNFADLDMEIHFMKNVAMAGGYAVLVGFGGGAYTLGRLFGRS
jgi:putative oxidoreductase